MFHLNFNRKRGHFDAEELRCLCRALGFQPDLIATNLPKDGAIESCLSIKELNRYINLKYLDFAVDKTFNAHTADWNLCVFKKALLLIDHRVLTYQELHDVRVAFSMYENPDLKGMETDEKTINRCLKMCGRVMAPLKIQHRIKHMSQNFDEEGRIQLFEFLDLILWTELYDKYKIAAPEIVGAVDKERSIYKVEDFQHIIQHYDERLAQHLNELYLHEEWSFTKEEFSKQKLPNELPVSRDYRLNQMKRGRNNYKTLRNEVSKSQDLVHLTAAGHIRPRPITAPNLEFYEHSEKSSVHTAYSQHKLSVGELVRDYIHTPSIRVIRTADPALGHSRSKVKSNTQHTSNTVKPAVTEEEKNETKQQIQDLQFFMVTMRNRYKHQLNKDIEKHIPGYTPKPPVVEEATCVYTKKEVPEALREENINNLAYAPYRPPPKPSHANKCDARFRGWHKVKTTKGQHYVLASTPFSNTFNSKNNEKLHKTSCSQVKSVKGDCLTRKTTEDNVKVEINRPITAPATYEAPPIAALSALEKKVPDKNLEKQVKPSKLRASAGLRKSAKALKTIREGSAGQSTSASSARSYSFTDFRIYDEYERQKAEAKPDVDIHKQETETHKKATGNTPTVVVSAAQQDMESEPPRLRSDQDGTPSPDLSEGCKKEVKYHMYKDFVNRRNLSSYVSNRILESVSVV